MRNFYLGTLCTMGLAVLQAWLPSATAAATLLLVVGAYSVFVVAWWRQELRALGKSPEALRFCWWAIPVWPLVLGLHFYGSRGPRGLLPWALSLCVLLVAFGGFVGANLREELHAERLIDAGRRELSVAAGPTAVARRKQALRQFKEALELDDDNWAGYYLLFLACYELEDLQTAERYFQRLLAQGKDLPPDGRGVGWFLAATHQTQIALRYWTLRSQRGDSEAAAQIVRYRANLGALALRWRDWLAQVPPMMRPQLRREIAEVDKLLSLVAGAMKESRSAAPSQGD
jgi:tetratricopeptide (TPR) repeat protein